VFLCLGFAMSPFWIPELAAFAVGIAAAGLAAVLGAQSIVAWWGDRWGGYCLAIAASIAVGLMGYWSLATAISDAPPALEYSLRALTQDDAAGLRQPGEVAWYRLRVTNVSLLDVDELHISAHLPFYLSAAPRLITSSFADSSTCRSSYAIATRKRSPDSPTEPIAGFTNVGIVEARRLSSGGSLDVLFPVLRAVGTLEDGRYGVIVVRRHHRHYNVDVADSEALGIIRVAPGTEALDARRLPVETTKRNWLIPQIPTDDIERGGGLGFEAQIE